MKSLQREGKDAEPETEAEAETETEEAAAPITTKQASLFCSAFSEASQTGAQMTMAMAAHGSPASATASTSTANTPKLGMYKSSSLDHEIYTTNRRSTIATAASDWKALRAPLNGRSMHVGSPSSGRGSAGMAGNMTRAASTSSLASSTRTMTNYQEYKMEIINQVMRGINQFG